MKAVFKRAVPYADPAGGPDAKGVGGPAGSQKGREVVYRSNPAGGPDAKSVGGPAGSQKGREAVY